MSTKFFCCVLAQGCVFLMSVLLVTPASAEVPVVFAESPSSVQQLPEVLVTDTRLPSIQENILAVPAKVTVISAEDIQRSGATTVQEAVSQATGVVMYNQVGNAFEQTIDFRGFNGTPVSATSVFVDGVRVNDPEFGFVNFDLIPLETIERIEIIPSASATYGKNALGGVINILTKRGSEQRNMTGETAFGSFGRQRYTFNTSGPIGKFDYYGSLSRERENGYRDGSDAKLWRGFGKVGYAPIEGTDLTASYTYVKDNLEQAGSLPRDMAGDDPKANFTPGDFFDRENNFVRLTARQVLPGGFTFTGNGFYRRLQQESFLVSQPFFVGGMNSISRNYVDTESWGGTFQLAHEAEVGDVRNVLSVGGEVAWNDFRNKLVFGTSEFPRKSEEEVSAIFVQNTVHIFSHLVLVGGFRYDRNELDFRDLSDSTNDGRKVFHRTTPRAGLTYFLVPQSSIFFSYSQGFRVPTNDELFAQGVFGSDPNLKAVRSHNFELGLKSSLSDWGKLSLALYQMNLRDEIIFTCVLCNFSPGDGKNRNIKKTRRRGVELTLDVKPHKMIAAQVNYTYTQAEFRTPFSVGAFANRRDVSVGDSIPLVPKHRVNLTGTIYPLKDFSLSINAVYVAQQYLSGDENNARDQLAEYFILNGRMAYEQPVWGGNLRAFLQINNILNNKYFTSGIYASNNISGGGATDQFVVPAPGIGLFGGLNYRFESFPF